MRSVSEIKRQRAGMVSPTQLPPCGHGERDGVWIVWDSVKNDFKGTYRVFAEAISFRMSEHNASPAQPLLRVWWECDCGWIGPEVPPREINPAAPPDLMNPTPRHMGGFTQQDSRPEETP
jgi:hypothetical protein